MSEIREDIFYQLFEFAPDAIVVVDQDGHITRSNAKAETLFGYSGEELAGQPVEILIPHRLASAHVGRRASYLAEPRARPMGAGLDLYAKRKNDTEFPVDIMLSPVQMQRERLVLCVIRDITDRRTAEAQAREAMRREVLLRKEIHHRVKNNLQVISSLLYLQSISVTDKRTQQILVDSQNRVKSIALIHEKLHHSSNSVSLDFADYVNDLLASLTTYRVRQEGIVVHADIERIHLGLDTAIPCGLIVNELVSNAFKHAFPHTSQGEIFIGLHPLKDNRYALSVRDNGIGLPEHFDPLHTSTLGLQLVTDLTRQIDGELEFSGQGGTTFQVSFAEVQYKDREQSAHG